MQSLKNRKRLTSVAIAFLLTFVIGAAFAFPPGLLEIGGIVSVSEAEMCAIWVTADICDDPDDATSTHEVRITSCVTNGLPAHRIEWAIGFVEFREGTVTLTATAQNDGDVDIEMLTPVFNWGTFGASSLTHTIDATDFLDTNPLSPGDVTGDLIITISTPTGGLEFDDWASSIAPASAGDMTAWMLAQLPGTDYAWVTNFYVEVVYQHVP
ncbi:MAG: hypothetical protein FWC77_02715 [Defluviitaleaceae bacterium]|nr:hypothetical protein [Defluviitaleaceae bacterium]